MGADRVVDIAEKPSVPRSRLAVTGCYMYYACVLDIIRWLAPTVSFADGLRRTVEWYRVNTDWVESVMRKLSQSP